MRTYMDEKYAGEFIYKIANLSFFCFHINLVLLVLLIASWLILLSNCGT